MSEAAIEVNPALFEHNFNAIVRKVAFANKNQDDGDQDDTCVLMCTSRSSTTRTICYPPFTV